MASENIHRKAKGKLWEQFKYVYINREVRDGPKKGVILFRPVSSGTLQEPGPLEKFDVAWRRDDGTYDVTNLQTYSYAEVKPLVTESFVSTQNNPGLVTALLLPLQEKNWDLSPDKLKELKQAAVQQQQLINQQAKAAGALLEQQLGTQPPEAEAQPARKQQPQPQKQQLQPKKKSNGQPAAKAAAATAAAAKGKPAAAQPVPLKAGLKTKAYTAAAAKKAAAAAAKPAAKAAAPPAAKRTAGKSLGKQQQQQKQKGAAAAGEGEQEAFLDALEDEAVADDDELLDGAVLDGSGGDSSSSSDSDDEEEDSEEEEDDDDGDDDDDDNSGGSSESEEQQQPSWRRGARRQQQQAGTPAKAAGKRHRAAAAPAAAAAAQEEDEDDDFREVQPQGRKRGRPAKQQQQQPDKAKQQKVGRPMAEKKEYKGWTGRLYPASLALKVGDLRLGTPEYSSGNNSDVEFVVEGVMDEVEVMIAGRKKVKLLVKWQGYELDVDAWEPAENFQDTKAFEDWQGRAKPAWFTAVKASDANKAFRTVAEIS